MSASTILLDHDWFPEVAPSNVVIGPRSWLHSSYAFLHYRSRRPVGLRVGHNTGIYIETFFDLGPDGEIEIGNYCTLAGPVFSTNGRVKIGDHVFLSREVLIADRPAATPPDGEESIASQEIIIGDTAWIGARAILLPGAHLGEGAIIGAAAAVDFAVPPFAVVAGNPARIVGFCGPPAKSGSPFP